MARTNPSFLNGVPELLILRLLSDHEMYGYQIVKAISEATRDEIMPGEGVVYPILHALEQKGLVSSRRKTVAGRSRVYYELTKKGMKRLDSVRSDWARITEAITRVVEYGAGHGSLPTHS